MKKISKQSKKNIFIFSLLIIPIALLTLLLLYPTLKMFELSFTNWNGLSKTYGFIGVKNYGKVLFKSPDVWLSLRNNGLYFVVHLLFIPVEIFIAFLLNSKIKGSKFFKTIVFLPYIINGVAVSYMFSMIFSSYNGALNEILQYFSIGPVKWLSDEKIVNFSLASVSLWRFCGMHIVLFLAAITSVPKSILDAAEVDGANTFKQYIHIIIPNIRPVIEIVLFLNLRGALQVFDIPFIMTGGGPGYASSTFTLYTIETAFNFSNYGKASAMAIILMLLILTINKIQTKIFNKKEA